MSETGTRAAPETASSDTDAIEIEVPVEGGVLRGRLDLPPHAPGLVLFAHGSGSSRLSPRNRAVADLLNAGGFGTLLFDLLTEREDAVDRHTAEYRFDIPLLTRRLVDAIDWALSDPRTRALRIGLFGASTGAAAALGAAAARPFAVQALVARGGRPDLAGEALSDVCQPVLLIVGALDTTVLGLNRDVASQMPVPPRIEVIPGASHLFEEPGTQARMAELALSWLREHL